jgi:hypothetical protein
MMFRLNARRIAAAFRTWAGAAGRTYADALGMPRDEEPSLPAGHPERLDPREPTESERRLWADLQSRRLKD